MSTPFLGQIDMFGGNFAPKTYAFCNGQLLPISQNSALFSLLGTTYGGDGKTTFALPDLRSRLPMHFGQGPRLSNYVLGESAGSTTTTILMQEMPIHTHTLNATKAIASEFTIGTSVLPGQPTVATSPNTPAFYAAQAPQQPPLTPHPMDPRAVGSTGGSQSHTNLMPSLCVTFIIALQGIFPSRN